LEKKINYRLGLKMIRFMIYLNGYAYYVNKQIPIWKNMQCLLVFWWKQMKLIRMFVEMIYILCYKVILICIWCKNFDVIIDNEVKYVDFMTYMSMQFYYSKCCDINDVTFSWWHAIVFMWIMFYDIMIR